MQKRGIFIPFKEKIPLQMREIDLQNLNLIRR